MYRTQKHTNKILETLKAQAITNSKEINSLRGPYTKKGLFF